MAVLTPLTGWEGILDPGEKVLWQGRPDPKLHISGVHVFSGVFGLIFAGFALIWMGLVPVGLMLTLWQVLFDRATAWLLGRAAALGLATLYLCSFVNFAHIIASQNLDRERPDMPYICDLGPMAAGAVAHAIITRPDHLAAVRGQRPCPALRPHTIRHWQEWGFRKWSVGRYTAEVTQRSALNENPDRR